MKIYAETTLRNKSKEELIQHILTLQHNLVNEEKLNDHIYKTVTQVAHNNPAFSNELVSVLEVWNRYSGHRYSE